jgi:xanthine dehydrogenase YagR molybdenum-binding subunit
MSAKLTGQGIDRIDGRLKVTGKADYSADVPVANVAHAVIVTSAVGRGHVTLDVTAAKRVPGVLSILTHVNAPKLPGATKRLGPIDRLQQVLQDNEIHYNDQPIALVIAETLEQAHSAASLV